MDKSLTNTEVNELSLKKESFLKAYQKSFGNITIACKSLDISRQAFYKWKNTDSTFVKELEEIEPGEVFVDFCENALAKKIESGDTTAIIFALKTQGKKRGYIERTELTGKDGKDLNYAESVRHAHAQILKLPDIDAQN